jgi:nucleoside-diphosphate-sugar epimerase
MKVIIFGATGMVGQGVLRECLLDQGVESVLCVGRSPVPNIDSKLRELLVRDPGDLSAVTADVSGFDACFFCLGVSAGGMSEQNYRRLTLDLTLGAARTLAGCNPGMTFIYV